MRKEVKDLFDMAEVEAREEELERKRLYNLELKAEEKAKMLEYTVEHLNPNALIAVHQTNHFPKGGKLKPTGHFLLDLFEKKNPKKVIEDCMGVSAGEKVLIIADTKKQRIGEALFNAAINVKSEAMYILMLPRSRHGEEPILGIAELMKHVDVIVAPTSCSLTHTQARREASKLGVRIATMPDITDEMFDKGGLTADFKAVRDRIERAYEKIKEDPYKVYKKIPKEAWQIHSHDT